MEIQRKLTKKTFTGTVWDEKHARVKAGGSKTVSMVSCSLEAGPTQWCDGWSKHVLPTSVGTPGPCRQHGCSGCRLPMQGDQGAAVGTVHKTTGTELPLLLAPELHRHAQEESLGL